MVLSPTPHPPRGNWWPIVLLTVVTMAAYGNALGLGFLWDDNYQILRNPLLRDPANIPQIFSSAFWDFINPNQAKTSNYYRPMQALAYMLGYHISGLAPWSFHLISVLLHGAVTLMAYFLCLRWSMDRPMAMTAALLFAVHPIHTESVTWVAGVPDVLCALFYFLAFYFYMQWRRQPSPRPFSRLAGACLAFFLALLSKEMALTLPFMILIWEWLHRDSPGALKGNAWLGHLAPFLGVVLVYLLIRWRVLGFFATVHNPLPLDSADLFLLRMIFLFDYARQAVLPFSLNAYHMVRLSGYETDPRLYGGLALLAAAGWLAFRFRRRPPYVTFGILWFLVTLAPVLNLQAVSASLYAERYLYIPSLSVCWLAALLLHRWCAWLGHGASTKTKDYGLVAAAGLLIVVFLSSTILRNYDWKDNVTLFSKTIQSSPYSALAHNMLGMEYIRNPTQRDQAEKEFKKALSVLALDYYQPAAEAYRAYIGLGVAQFQRRDYSAARAAFQRALELDPGSDWAYSYLAAVQIQGDKNLAEGMTLLQKALAINPHNEVSHNLMGLALFNAGQYSAAAAAFQTALRILPTSVEAREYLKMAEGQLQKR